MTGSVDSAIMVGCRRSCELLGSPERMLDMIRIIEENINPCPSIVFDACKSLIEYTCKIILANTNAGYENGWNLPKFIKSTTDAIRLTPNDYDGDNVAGPLFRNIASGIGTTVQHIGELRSKEGLLAHGAVGYSRQLEYSHARFVAISTDALVELLVFSSKNYWVNVEIEPNYEENADFNQLMDDSLIASGEDGFFDISVPDGTKIVRLKSSDVLYRLDKEQYIELLKEHLTAEEDTE